MIKEQVAKSFELQDKLNSVVNPNWKKAGYPWYRAAWIEAAELMDHFNYKWWKNVDKEIDKEQALLELVDIYHFLVSDMLQRNISPHAVTTTYNKVSHLKPKDKEEILLEIEAFVTNCAETQMILPVDFTRMVVMCGFTLENVLKWYIAKNCLNIFRQENGYKEGKYIKVWNDKEDNVVLADLVATCETVDYDQLHQQLTEAYSKVTK